jgi:hypothetical protein
VGVKPEIQEEYKRMDEDMRISLAALIDSFVEFLIPPPSRRAGETRAPEWTDANITLLEATIAGANAAGTLPRATVDRETRKIAVVTRVRAPEPQQRILQRSPWHIWSDVFTSLFIALIPELRTRNELDESAKPLQMVQRISKEGRFAIPTMLLDSLTPYAQVIAMMGFAAFQDWLRLSVDARALLNLNLRIWQTNPPFEAVFMARMCEYLETYDRPQPFETAPLPFDGLEWAKARPLLANAAVPWALQFVGETVSDLNVMWWPDHLSPEDKNNLIRGLERLHSQASLMTQMLLHS